MTNSIDYKIHNRYCNWIYDLTKICFNKGMDLKKYNKEIIADYFAEGLTPEETYKQLLSELELPDEE